ncbi:putative dehydrogenase [[Clostridium] ultunense Esp]|nr:putative dehydrogenase [[Clostridium] ultunense Esp]
MNIAVIGLGTMGKVHAAAYAQMEGVRLVAVVDIRKDVVEEIAGAYHVIPYINVDEVLENKEIDVIDICLPTYLHKEVTVKGARKKKHIICEKPIARTLQEADEMIRICKEEGVELMIAQVLRFFPEYKKAHQAIQSGRIGKVGRIHTFRGGVFPTAWEDWYASIDKSGSLIVDMVIHDIDFLRWTFGEVERVYAKNLTGKEMNRLDHAFISIRFRNGAIAHVEGTWSYPEGFKTELEVAGSEGILSFRSEDAVPIYLSLRSKKAGESGVAVPESPLRESPYYLELEHFIHCLKNGEKPLVTAYDAYKALEISLAALHSAQTGEIVTL